MKAANIADPSCHSPESAVTSGETRQRVVVVGNGMVSHAFCDKLVRRKALQKLELVVIGAEERPAYDRVNLTQFFAGRSPEDLELADAGWYRDAGITLRLGERVLSIDREQKTIETSGIASLEYDTLVLATGARPFVPPIPGADLPGVFVYRTVDDLLKIKRFSQQARSAAVLGGGLLGLEAAKAVVDLGLAAHVVEMAPSLMPRQLDADGGAALCSRIRKMGVDVHLRKRTEAIEEVSGRYRLHFDHGAPLDVDLVIVSAGIRPRDELATECGLRVGKRGGIVVSNRLATSDPDIYAIGECALHEDVVYGLVAPGYQMADVLAENLLGGETEFTGGDLSARLKLMDVDVATIGEPLGETPNASTISWSDGREYRKLILVNRRVVGAMGVGEWPELERYRQMIAAGRRLWPWNLGRFESTGRLWGQPSQSVAEWPENAMVCGCKRITRRQLTEACAAGCASVDDIAQETGASTVCGSCTPLLQQMLGAQPSGAAKASRGLLAFSAMVIGITSLWLRGPLPYSDSVQTFWYQVDNLWRNDFWKQFTGFSLVVLSGLALLLSLRKRISRFQFGDYRLWRTVHSALGLLTIAGLVAHTGMRVGHNLNFVLACTFLGLNVVGGLTGILSAMESRRGGAAMRWIRSIRPHLTRLHIWMFLPLPALVVIHIVCVYYF